MAAAVAKIAVRRVGSFAFGTGYFKLTAAFVAESGIGGVFRLASRALHFSLSIRRRSILLCNTSIN
jgi:hypothetical protein